MPRRDRARPAVSRSLAIAFGAAMAAAAFAAMLPVLPSRDGPREGEIAAQDYVAAENVTYESEVLTEIEREAAAAAVEMRWTPIDPRVRQEQLTRAAQLFDQIAMARARPGAADSRTTEVTRYLETVGVSPEPARALVEMTPDALATLRSEVLRHLGAILEGEVRPDSVPETVTRYLSGATGTGAGPELRLLVGGLAKANVAADEAATARLREAARAVVVPQIVQLSRGQVVLRRGQPVDADAVEKLRRAGTVDEQFDIAHAGAAALVAAGFGLLLGTIGGQERTFRGSPARRMAVVVVTTVVVLSVVRFGAPQLLPDNDGRSLAGGIPVAAAAVVAATVGDLTLGLVLAGAIAIVATFAITLGTALPGSLFLGSLEAFDLAAAYAAGGVAGALAVQRVQRLSRFALAGLATALATAGVMAAFWLMGAPHSTERLFWIGLAAAAGGALSAVTAAGVFLLLPSIFGVSTRLQLLELAQPEAPLLRRLQDEAPGTYHHSMLVGALAERAAEAIGADGLLARVGAYYHDVGKLARPAYFIENLTDDVPSPHDGLAPSESASIIRAHTVDGLEVARRYRLPPVIRDFIPQHHGTRLVAYFYRRAVQGGDVVDTSRFRYAGPRPQTREAAIVMLADSCDALARARGEGGRSEIDQLVDNVFAERLAEGQMDECDITMRELQSVASSFKATLRAVYHPRIEYPQPGPEEIAAIARTPA